MNIWTKIRQWYHGWKSTLKIRFFEPEIYKKLQRPGPKNNEPDGGPVPRP